MAKAIPDGFHTVTPSFTFKDSEKAIEFYKKAFAAEVIDFLRNPNGKGTMHATIQIGNSIIMMGDEMPGSGTCKSIETIGSSSISLFLYVNDVDAACEQAVKAGAKLSMPPTDMFWGDRMGQVTDPFGYAWGIATHRRDLSKEEIGKGAEAFFAQMPKK